MIASPAPTNFAFLETHEPQLVRLGLLAERYFPDDPNTALLKLRQFAELLAQMCAANFGQFSGADESQYELIRRLQDDGYLPREIAGLFSEVRRTGNAANHALADDHRSALATLKLCWQLGIWFHRTFKDPEFKSGPFQPPKPPPDETADLRSELERLRSLVADHERTSGEVAQRLQFTEAKLKDATSEQEFWSEMAAEAEHSRAALERRLAELQTAGGTTANTYVAAGARAAADIVLDEAETRRLIDEQLNALGWTADTVNLTYAKGARPEKGKNLAIAEWPTESGPADYVLFAGLTPVATVEAKRSHTDVPASLQQAARYSRGFKPVDGLQSPGGPWDDGQYRIPFAFSTNGRPFVRQLATRSGVWFRDLRRPQNLAKPLDGWYTPEGLLALLALDVEKAQADLANQPYAYGFPLRDYQRNAIEEVQGAVERGQREMLLAMATGTGKTITCIALIYRLLKAKRFRRILFVVDRSALGEQAANAFKDTRMENLQTFADVFGIKEIDQQAADADTSVHIATIQGMVRRVLSPGEDVPPPPVDAYDCIIVDECHRGYLLDRELSEMELTFRSFEDYVSKYRRVLDHFDAVKIGLTATPALHTTQIFGAPIFTYSYREAVIDGFLVDHEPPIQIRTDLSTGGIIWRAGEQVTTYDPRHNQLSLFTTPDEIKVEVEGFNRSVITEPFNRVVCRYLAREIDPSGRGKTLIFCVNDAHADLVVSLLKEAFAAQYGEVDDDAVVKITGAADKPLQLIRRFRNERNPNVAVTVDLLTTGIDVHEITNLVFLRRVNSRILFDQMLGRATRLCPEIGKETFRVFDAVQLYDTLGGLTAMTPVVADPNVTFSQLAAEMVRVNDDDARALVLDQFVAKLQRKKAHLSEASLADFEAVTGVGPAEFIRQLRGLALDAAAEWFARSPDLGAILDRAGDGPRAPLLVSEHPDQLQSAAHGYGAAGRPEDYIEAFSAFVRDHINDIPALVTVVTRPRELTRKQLRELALALDRAGFNETNLATAYRETTNRDIAARIVGFVRQAALGDPLVPYEQRVDAALRRILESQSWTAPQREWLKKIAAQTRANVLVDRAALDEDDLIFKREGGGFARLDRIFDHQLEAVLQNFNDYIWEPVA